MLQGSILLLFSASGSVNLNRQPLTVDSARSILPVLTNNFTSINPRASNRTIRSYHNVDIHSRTFNRRSKSEGTSSNVRNNAPNDLEIESQVLGVPNARVDSENRRLKVPDVQNTVLVHVLEGESRVIFPPPSK